MILMTQVNFSIEEDIKSNDENIAELERQAYSIANGTSTLKEHELIEVDD